MSQEYTRIQGNGGKIINFFSSENIPEKLWKFDTANLKDAKVLLTELSQGI